MLGTGEGGCACGAIRYRVEGDPEFTFNCHCRKCQRATGSGHAAAFAVPLARIHLTGELRYHAQSSDSGARTFSGFCGACGSPIASRTERFPERLYVLAASLDDSSAFTPGFAIFAEAATRWDPPDAALLEQP